MTPKQCILDRRVKVRCQYDGVWIEIQVWVFSQFNNIGELIDSTLVVDGLDGEAIIVESDSHQQAENDL